MLIMNLIEKNLDIFHKSDEYYLYNFFKAYELALIHLNNQGIFPTSKKYENERRNILKAYLGGCLFDAMMLINKNDFKEEDEYFKAVKLKYYELREPYYIKLMNYVRECYKVFYLLYGTDDIKKEIKSRKLTGKYVIGVMLE